MIALTSINPKDPPTQRLAIYTWRDLGLEIYSMNHASELHKVRPLYPNIKFVETNGKTGRDIFDTKIPYPRLYNMIEWMCNTGKTCLLINSDIQLRTSREYLDFLYKISDNKQTSVFGHRVNIDAQTNEQTWFLSGLDWFFIHPSLKHVFDKDAPYCLGTPFWDYWVPLTLIRKQCKPIRYNINNFAYHIDHKINWTSSSFNKFCVILANELNIGIEKHNYDSLTTFTHFAQNLILTKSVQWTNIST